MKRTAVTAAVLLGILAGAASAQRRDPPTFVTDYTPPPTFEAPQPRPWSQAQQYVDFGVLAAALCLGALFALKLRSRLGVAVVMVFSLFYFGFYRMGCLCPIGSIQNVSEAMGGEIRVSLDDGKIAELCRNLSPPRGEAAKGLSDEELRARLREQVRSAAREHFRSRLSRLDVKSICDVEPRLTVLVEKTESSRAELQAAALRFNLEAGAVTETPDGFVLVLPKRQRIERWLEDASARGLIKYRPLEVTEDRFELVLRRNSWNRPVLAELQETTITPPAPAAAPVALRDICKIESGLGALPWLVVGIFALPLVFALFFGRVFCGSVCPLGAVQDVVLIRPLRLPLWLERSLRLLAVAYLAFAVLLAVTGSIYLICAYDPFVSLFRIIPVGKFLRFSQQSAPFGAAAGDFFRGIAGRWELLVLPVSFVVISMFVGRPYCRFLCPYGVLLRLLSRLSWKHASITPDECVKCRLCEDACPFNAIDAPAPAHRPTGWDRKRLAIVLAVVPVLIALGGWGGWLLGEPLSRAHLKVRLKDRLEIDEHLRLAEAGAVRPPARIAGRIIGVEKDNDRLAAVCRDGAGNELWRRNLLDKGRDNAMTLPEARLVRLASAEDGGRKLAVLIVKWTHLAKLSGPEELKSLFYLALDDGRLIRRQDVAVRYDPAEAFGRRKYVTGGAAGEDRPAAGKEQMLDEDVAAVRATFRWGGLAVGLFLASAVGWNLLGLSVTRSREDYEANRASCVSCGRCFAYCPRERLRRKQKGQQKDT